LTIVAPDARAKDAARLFSGRRIDFLVVCRDSTMIGVVTKTDVLAQVDRSPLGTGFDARLDEIMSRSVLSCSPTDALADFWRIMNNHGLERVPVLNADQKPVGVLHARDALQCLFGEAEIEDELLRDYISGAGYQ
jgi:CBS domain-containing protein